MSIINYYKTFEDFNMVDYYSGLECELVINEEHIETLYMDRKYCVENINDQNSSEQEKRISEMALMGISSSASNDIFEKQLSKIFDITHINTKHGWDGNDEINNEPYEFKPTKIDRNFLGANVNINDESENKINNISNHKLDYNNYEGNFVIVPINKNTSEFVCIYKFKENILYRSRIENLEKPKKPNQRCIYSTNIKKCIELSKKYSEKYHKWHNPKFF
tara:strand:+ start:209 stop:868 length:660 start_codon:yes stop_codon:yes gene_type:complete